MVNYSEYKNILIITINTSQKNTISLNLLKIYGGPPWSMFIASNFTMREVPLNITTTARLTYIYNAF